MGAKTQQRARKSAAKRASTQARSRAQPGALHTQVQGATVAGGQSPWRDTRVQLPVMLLVLVVAVVAVFVRVTRHDFVYWDDGLTVYGNPNLNPVSWGNLGNFWQQPYGSLYIPLSYSVYALLALISGTSPANQALTDTGTLLNPHVFHIANLGVHMVNVLLVFAILRLLTRSDLPALFGALLFGLHPLQVESVAWVSELRGLLCGFFSLLSSWLYLLSARDTRSTVNGRLWYAAAMPAGLLAILCKPSAITLPLLLFVLDRWCIGRTWEKALAAIAPLLVINLLFLPITQAAQPVSDSVGTAIWTRPFIAGDALAFYLLKLVAPFKLGVDYGHTPAEVTGHWWGYVTWIVPAMLGYLIWLQRRALPWLVPAALLSVAALLPVLGFVPFDFQRYSTVADRYAYLAMLGPALAVAFAVTRWRLTVLLPFAIVILLGLSVLSYSQAGVWRNTIALMTQALQVNGRSYSAYSNLGVGYLAHNQLDAADASFQQALRLAPDSWQSYNGLGISFLRRHEYKRAIAEYRAAIAIYPYAAEVHDNLGVALALQGDEPRAIRSFQIALALNPGYAKAKADLAWSRRRLGSTHPAKS